ncbi:MAG: ABC transporter permease [Casimicrobiaceae bacterium]
MKLGGRQVGRNVGGSAGALAVDLPPAQSRATTGGPGLGPLAVNRALRWLRTPGPYLLLLGFAIFLGLWHLTVEVWQLPRFKEMPRLTTVVTEWLSKSPTYGISIYTAAYYQHMLISTERVAIAFVLSSVIGISLGLVLGWFRVFKAYVFPIFELFRPIPPLAWVPLSIVLISGTEKPIIFLTAIAPFFATTLNTILGVESIDVSYTRAALCLGASRWQVFRHIVLPGALPFIFTGLEISMGLSWFSLVAGEMLSGNFGLGYLIIYSFMNISYPNIVIGMFTLGALGYLSSALLRMIGRRLMQWRVRELALGGIS